MWDYPRLRTIFVACSPFCRCRKRPELYTLAEARGLLDLARARNIAPIPTRNRPLGEAQAALDDLRAGRIVGRTVLTA